MIAMQGIQMDLVSEDRLAKMPPVEKIRFILDEVKSGKIHDEYMTIESIPLAHYYPGPDDHGYPLNTEKQKLQIMIEGMAQAIEGCLASFESAEAAEPAGKERVLRALPD